MIATVSRPTKSRRNVLALALLAPIMLAAGCAHYPRTGALSQSMEAELLQRIAGAQMERSPELHVVLAFSGGGTRAAALSYGVLEELARVRLPAGAGGARRLLDEVDSISSVSGGSFTAAYYALHGDAIFQHFPEKFLYQNVNGGLLKRLLLAPPNWMRLSSRWYARGDLAAAYYDDLLFHGATFRDVWDRGGPLLQIQATDIASGSIFSFTPQNFDLICADLGSFSVARAVAASSAFPGAFSPITVENHAGQCDSTAAAMLSAILDKESLSRPQLHAARERSVYLDAERQPYIHLMDGGIADNLGVRGPLELTTIVGGLPDLMRRRGMERVQKVVAIVVNAQQPQMKAWGRNAAPPGMMATLGALSGAMLNRYAFDTAELLDQSLKQWASELRQYPEWKALETYVIEVNLAALQDDAGAAPSKSPLNPRNLPLPPEIMDLVPTVLPPVPTSLTLPPATADLLRAAAKRLLWESPDFQRLVHDLGASVQAEAAMDESEPAQVP